MTAFADASAIVKLSHDEAGSDVVRDESHLVVSALSRVEVTSAIWRKHRMSELSSADARTLIDAFLADWSGSSPEPPIFLPVSATTSVLDRAVALCGVHGLRAYDAIQLASALAARAAAVDVSTFLGFDAALSRAAATEGFAVGQAS